MGLLKTNYNTRIFGLDVMRAIAILIVCWDHSIFMLNGTSLEFLSEIRLIDGVEIFFVLSGFLIGSILLKIYHKSEKHFSFKELWMFWNRRWMRTVPLYLIILLVNIYLVNTELINGQVEAISIKFVFFLQNFSSSFQGFFWESWSLSVEEWFYMITPLLLILLQFVLPKKKAFFITILVLMLAPLIYRLAIAGSYDNLSRYHWDIEFRKVVITRLDTIMYGVLWAFIKFHYTNFFVKWKWLFAGLGLIGVVCLLNIPKDPNSFYLKTIYFSVVPLSVSLFIPLMDAWKTVRSFIGKFVIHISLISYVMYLVNLALVVQVINKNFPIVDPSDGMMKFGLFWLIVIGLSTLIYFFIEKPILNLRNRIWK